MDFSYSLAKTYIELNAIPKFTSIGTHLGIKECNAEKIIEYLNNLSEKEGFIFKNYCPSGEKDRRFFSDENGRKIDAIRIKIQEWKELFVINENEFHFLITALLESVNLVSNIAGTYGAFLKEWDNRALKPIKLSLPKIIYSRRKNLAFKQDSNDLIKEIRNIDILYLDPPYNNRQYSSNYFLLDLIARGWFEQEQPMPIGATGIINYRDKISAYCYKEKAGKALEDLVMNANAKYILLSYNNEGVIPDNQLIQILSKKGNLHIFTKTHKRYRSINQDENDPQTTEERLFLIETDLARKRANKLDGSSWLQNSFSIWRDIKKNQEEIKLNHPAIFPIQLAERIIEIFTNGSGKNILDCFAGSGSTLIAGLKKGMNVYGTDISDEFHSLFMDRVENNYAMFKEKGTYKYFVTDIKKINKYIEPNSIDLCLTSPPYWNILNSRRSADLKTRRNYSNEENDIGNIESYDEFLKELRESLQEVSRTLKDRGFFIIVVMDIRKGNKFYPLHMHISRMMEKIGFNFEDLIIWDRQNEYNNCKPLGYPYKFIVNKIHEYILIFRKI